MNKKIILLGILRMLITMSITASVYYYPDPHSDGSHDPNYSKFYRKLRMALK